MKRMNLMVNEELLEQAREATGERTYSATVNTALEELVRRRDFRVAFEAFSERVANGEQFAPGYVEEQWPEVAKELNRTKRAKLSAHDRRLPQVGKKRRAAR
jgi:hypothetical protein